jgi:hypothetical protein
MLLAATQATQTRDVHEGLAHTAPLARSIDIKVHNLATLFKSSPCRHRVIGQSTFFHNNKQDNR